jgi:hypothetical protein
MAEELRGSVVLLIAPTPSMATALAQRFEGLQGVRVIQERRRPWPDGERRRMLQMTALDRRRSERRRPSRFRFEGTLIEGAP